jgi:acyl carrier protein
MTSVDERLRGCFQAVFPGINAAAIPAASTSTIADWDSVVQVTLISVIEEEFSIVIPEEQYGDLLSFGAWAALLEASQQG